MKKVTWNDMMNGHHKDVQKAYKLTDRQFEQSIRRHLDGANASERREVYEKVWAKKDKE